MEEEKNSKINLSEINVEETLLKFFKLKAQYARHLHFESKIGLSPALHISKVVIKNRVYYVCYDFGIIIDGNIEETESVKEFFCSQIVEYLVYYFINNKIDRLYENEFEIPSENNPWKQFIEANRMPAIEMWKKFLDYEIYDIIQGRIDSVDRIKMNKKEIKLLKDKLLQKFSEVA